MRTKRINIPIVCVAKKKMLLSKEMCRRYGQISDTGGWECPPSLTEVTSLTEVNVFIKDVVSPVNRSSHALLCLASSFHFSFAFGWQRFASWLFAKQLWCWTKMFRIRWLSEEVLKKEKVLAESNRNDCFNYQKDRGELERKGKKSSDWS